MTVESNYVIAIGLKESCQFFNQWEAKPKAIAPCTRDFSRASGELQVIARFAIGSSRCLLLLWLVGVIALVLVFRQSFENRSKPNYLFREGEESRWWRWTALPGGLSAFSTKSPQVFSWPLQWSAAIEQDISTGPGCSKLSYRVIG